MDLSKFLVPYSSLPFPSYGVLVFRTGLPGSKNLL